MSRYTLVSEICLVSEDKKTGKEKKNVLGKEGLGKWSWVF